MSYAGLGAAVFTVTAPAADAWRTIVKQKAVEGAKLATTLKWPLIINQLNSLAASSGTLTPEFLAVMVSAIKPPVLPLSWANVTLTPLRTQLVNLLAGISAAIPKPQAAVPMKPSIPKILTSPTATPKTIVAVSTPAGVTKVVTSSVSAPTAPAQQAPMTTSTPTALPPVPAPAPAATFDSYSADPTLAPAEVPADSFTMPTWDTTALPSVPQIEVPAVPATPAGLLGVPWKFWGIGAAVAVGGYLVMNRGGAVKANRRRARRRR